MNTKPIDRVLNKWLRTHGYELTVFADTEFAYYMDSSKISYTLVVTKKQDEYFLDFAKSKGLKVDCGIFILSFLHEVGHDNTIDDFEDSEQWACADIASTLKGDNKEDNYTYFNLPTELAATQWAIDYINNNTEEIAEMAEQLQRVINRFYKKYKVEA